MLQVLNINNPEANSLAVFFSFPIARIIVFRFYGYFSDSKMETPPDCDAMLVQFFKE
jgi:hypothetical protein